MTRAIKTKRKRAETPLYLYIFGLAVKLSELLKVGCTAIFRHITELLMALSFGGMLAAAQAFDSGALSFGTAMLLIVVLAVLLVLLIRVEILKKK